MNNTENFNKIISKIKCDFLLYQPFFGLILAKLNVKLLSDKDNSSAYAYTDGRNIYFFENNINDLSVDNIKFIICHEIMHLLLDHLVRKEDRDPIIWNFATDYIINYLLNKDKNLTNKMPSFALFDSFYNDKWNAESIYNDLIKNNGSRDNKLKIINNNVIDNRDKKLDLHGIKDEKGEVSKENASYFASEICSELEKNYSSSNIPDYINRLVDSLGNINYNWKSILYKYIKKSIFRNNSTWKKPSRKSIAVNTFLPRVINSDYFKFNIAIDTSGSMDKKDISDVVSNILSMCKQLSKFTLNIFTFSGICHKDTLQTFTEKDIYKKFNNFNFETNWSTNITSAFDFVKENKDLQDADLFIVMTDGIDYSIDDLEYKNPLIWCICNNPKFKSPKNCNKSIIIDMPRGK